MFSNRTLIHWCALFLFTYASATWASDADTAKLDSELRAQFIESGMVAPDLIDALESSGRVGARIFFLDSRTGGETEIPLPDSEVSPVVVDLANTLLSGELTLHQVEDLQALSGVVNAEVVQALLGNPSVLSVELDEAAGPTEEVDYSPLAKAACVPTATRACLQGGRFSVTVFMSGALAKIASAGSDSAAFWRFSNSNWEVLAKVLNGCGVNNKFWVFGARASTLGYTLSVNDTVTGASIAFNGAVCPIANTTFFNCP